MFEVARYEPDPESVTLSRRWVENCLRSEVSPEVIRDATLCISELTANAVRHARTTCTVEIVLTGEVLRISVRDDHPGEPTRFDPDPTSVSGRGLAIVEAVSRRWGWTRDPAGGKHVWFELVDPA